MPLLHKLLRRVRVKIAQSFLIAKGKRKVQITPTPTPTPPHPSHPSSSPTSPPPKQTVERPRGCREGGGGAFSSGSREAWLDLAQAAAHVAPAVKAWWHVLAAASGEVGAAGSSAQASSARVVPLATCPSGARCVWWPFGTGDVGGGGGVGGISVGAADALGQRDFFFSFLGVRWPQREIRIVCCGWESLCFGFSAASPHAEYSLAHTWTVALYRLRRHLLSLEFFTDTFLARR